MNKSYKLLVELVTLKAQMNVKNLITNTLSFIFPYKDPSPNLSLFVEDTWIERNMQTPFIKDLLWTPPYKG